MPLIIHAVAFIYVNVNNAAGTFMKLHCLRCVSEKGCNQRKCVNYAFLL